MFYEDGTHQQYSGNDDKQQLVLYSVMMVFMMMFMLMFMMVFMFVVVFMRMFVMVFVSTVLTLVMMSHILFFYIFHCKGTNLFHNLATKNVSLYQTTHQEVDQHGNPESMISPDGYQETDKGKERDSGNE